MINELHRLQKYTKGMKIDMQIMSILKLLVEFFTTGSWWAKKTEIDLDRIIRLRDSTDNDFIMQYCDSEISRLSTQMLYDSYRNTQKSRLLSGIVSIVPASFLLLGMLSLNWNLITKVSNVVIGVVGAIVVIVVCLIAFTTFNGTWLNTVVECYFQDNKYAANRINPLTEQYARKLFEDDPDVWLIDIRPMRIKDYETQRTNSANELYSFPYNKLCKGKHLEEGVKGMAATGMKKIIIGGIDYSYCDKAALKLMDAEIDKFGIEILGICGPMSIKRPWHKAVSTKD